MKKKVMVATIILALSFWAGLGLAANLTDLEKLGGLIYRDKNLSLNKNQSCMTCHHPSAGFADPENHKNPVDFPVSDGSDPSFFGGRNAPTAAYAGFSPIFGWDSVAEAYVGGMFWDGRATGERLKDPLAEQALGPFLNPVEMALTIYDDVGDPTDDPSEVVARVKTANYAGLFEKVFLNVLPYNWKGWESDVYETYDLIGIAIAAFERSSTLNKFSSKFDTFWAACWKMGIDVSTIDTTTDLATLPQDILTTVQLQGLALFNDPGKGNCAACHVTTDYEDAGNVYPPLFTDFTYDNIGIPANVRVYELTGNKTQDLGLGGRDDINDSNEYGKFKVPTLRNAARTAPYGHNGFFPTLKEIVNFYNTRDVAAWDPPEVPETVNVDELGDLGLTRREEWAIVAFMQSLTDGM